MKHSTKIWLLQVLWLFLSFHTLAVPKDFSGKNPSYLNAGRLFESDGVMHVNAPPPPIIGDVSVCEGEVSVYTYPATPGYVYIWNVTNGAGTPSGNTFTVTWGNPGAGSVTLIVKDASGNVVDTQSLPITIHSKPYPFITASFSPTCKEKKGEGQNPRQDTADCLVACDSSIVVYSTPLNAGSTYTWTVVGANSYTPSGNTVTVYWGAPGTGLIRVEETNVYGCTNFFEKCVKIIESPNAMFTSVPAAVGGVINICDGQSVQFYDASTGSVSSPLMDWFWDFGDGFTSTDKNPNHTFSAGTWQVVMYVENECHCKDSFVVTVVVTSDPPPKIECISTVCANGVDHYHTPSGCAGATYNWSVTGGVITTPLPYGPDIDVQWGSSGPGIVSLQILGCAGICPSTASVVVSIISPTTTITGPNPACYFSTAIYSIPNMPGSVYTWTVTNGFIVSGQGTEQVEVNWFSGTSGTISVTYYNPTLYCGGSSTLVVNLRPPFTISGLNAICDGGNTTYNATPGTPAENAAYQWTITNSSNVVVATSSGSDSYNVTWSFGPGIYQITVTNSSGAFCNSPQNYFVTVYPAPPPPTFISGTSPVCPNQSYLYTSAPTVSGTFIQWNVTNGSPTLSSGNNLTVTWGPSGPYILSVSQVSMTYPYCPSPPFIDTIQSKLPPPSFSILGPSPVCKNSVQNYSASSTVGDDYTWTITPASYGSVISGQGSPNVTIQWNDNSGVATIGLSVTTCNVITNINRNITLTNPPNPVINGPSSICANVSGTYSTTTTGTAFSWDFGDGSPIVPGAGPQNHTYAAAGTYNITLTVTNPNGCVGQTSVVFLVNVKPAPDASISTGDPNAFCPGVPISTTMYVTSLLQPGSTIVWYINGSPIVPAATGLSYTANIAGAYTAVVTNVWGCSTTSNIINVIQLVTCTPCPIDPNVLNFSSLKTGCLTYSFSGNISANGRVLNWFFDDPYNGAGSTSLTPTHTYSEPGYYRVVFSGRFPKTGVPGDSCDRDTSMTIVVPIKAKFNYEITCGGSSNYNLNFFDLSTYVSPHTINSWTWTFPGGTPSSSTLQNPTGISFPAGSTPNVTLTITSVTGYTCTITLPVTVPNIPNLNIIAPDSTCQGNPVPFTTTVPTGPVNSWLWSFGDGSASALEPTTRTYTAPTSGSLTVNLTIIDQFGCPRVFSKPIFVNVNTVNPSISAGGPTTFCDGGNVVLTSSVSGATAPISYLWSTVDVTPNITVTQTGAYYVEVRDARGCHNKSNIINVLVNPVPQAMIVGQDSYCFGQPTVLSGYQGSTYTYQWLINNVPSSSGPTFSQTLAVGSYNFQIIITNTLNGCKDTSAIYPVIVHPLPPSPGVSVSPLPACEGSAITLTASTGIVPPYTFGWSTGDPGSSIVVYNAGNYTVTLTDQFGCQSKTTTQVFELPDFSNLLAGCYEFCDTADVTLVGPVGIGFTYQWYMNGSPIPGPVGTVKDLVIPVGANGIYNLEITTPAGCDATSPDIDVTFISCRDCRTDWKFRDIVCVLDTNGTQVYYFTIDLNNPFPTGATYTFSTPGGSLVGLTPAALVAGINTISGFYVDVPPMDNPLCISGTLYFDGKRCTLKPICIPLPKCDPPQPCNADGKWLSIVCGGKDASGNQTYYFDYQMNWGGANGSPILSLVSPDGTISSVSIADLNNGTNFLSGIFTDLAMSGQFCFEMYVFDPSTGRVCYYKDCVRLPQCQDVGNCTKKVLKLKTVKCNGFDINGNQTYKVIFNVSNPYGSASVYFSSPDGGISSVTPTSVPPGASTVTMIFTNLPPATGSICIDLIIVDDATGKTCTQEICFTLPICNDDGSFTAVNTQEENNSGNSISVNPNPAKDQTVISYTFTKGTSKLISVTDMYGRTIRVFDIHDEKGTITLQTGSYSPGVYMVTGFSDNKLVESKRLIIVK